jgi:serine/threonine protein kinase
MDSPTPSLEHASLRPGAALGKYRVLALLARGGMGQVYEAEDTLLKRAVALKVLSRELCANPNMLERFLREARAAAALNHPNVVPIYEVACVDGMYFIAMELAPGGSVDAHLQRHGRLPWRKATELIASICRGLAAAHDAGMIHRDIKPANILLAGQPKLADFGLSRQTAVATSLTESGVVLGTPMYMSPEQCRGERADPRSDVYSLGATFYALLTGRPPFPGANAMEMMFAHCSAPIPDPRAAVPEVPEACAAIVKRALAKEPADRFANAKEMARALKAMMADQPTLPFEAETAKVPTMQPAAPRSRRWVVGIVAAVALTVAAGYGIWWTSRGAPVKPNASTLRVLYVIPPRDFSASDYQTIRDVLQQEGVQMVTASVSREPCQHDERWPGASMKPDLSISEVRPTDFDALIFDGGVGSALFMEGASAEQAHNLIRTMAADGKPVGALAISPVVPARAGVLKGRRATGHDDDSGRMRFELEKAGAVLVDQPVVWDEPFLTGRDHAAAGELARTLVKKLRAQRR